MTNDHDPLTMTEGSAQWILRLYIAGQSPQSVKATANLRKLCSEYLEEVRCEIQIIDLLENPHLAERDQIVVIPTLVRRLPVPVKKVYGDLSNTEKVLISLQFPGQ